FMPCSWALRAALSAAICAAYGVDFREPLKPTWPEDAQEITAPLGSVMDTMVLLNVLLMCACPCATFFFSLRRTFLAPARDLGGMCCRLLVRVLLRSCCGGRASPLALPDERACVGVELPQGHRPRVERPRRHTGGVALGLPHAHDLPALNAHDYLAFFLPATVFFGPLRVRALVLVR